MIDKNSDPLRSSQRRVQIAEQAIKVRQLVEDLLASDTSDCQLPVCKFCRDFDFLCNDISSHAVTLIPI
jgi:hypothetical protein